MIIVSFTRVCRVGACFGFVRFAVLLSGVLCGLLVVFVAGCCWAYSALSGTLLYSAFTFGTESGMESVRRVSRSRWLYPGWTPKVAFKMASLVPIPKAQVRSKAA